MKSEMISLGGKAYEIHELPRRANAQWRQQFQVLIASVTNLVEASQVDITNTTDLVAVVGQVRDVLMQAPDEADLPLVVYTVKMGETSPGTAPMWPVTVTVNSYAATDAAAETLTAAVQAALDGFDGVDASYLVRALRP